MRNLKTLCLLLLLIAAVTMAAQSVGRRRTVVPPQPSAAPPVANADTYSVNRGQTFTANATNGVLLNDADPTGKPLSASLVSTTTQGTLTLNANGSFSYTSTSPTATSDSFTYRATNGSASSAVATVTLTIIDTAPVAVADSYTATASAIALISAPGVLVNDTINNAHLVSYGANTGTEQSTIGLGTTSEKGASIVLNADGSFSYSAPSSTFNGTDTFKYVLRNSGGSSTGTVTITVNGQTTPDFKVTSSGFAYIFEGISGQNPPLTLTRGRTYRFQIDTEDIHPFEITGAPAGSVTGNNTSFGIITFTVPNTASNYQYRCSLHSFGNTITTTP